MSSVKIRIFTSVMGNILRGGLNFFSILVIARGLGPESYGEFAFLLGSFSAIRALLDMGTTSAFFTFMSQKPRNIQFVLIYLTWQLFLFSLSLLIIGLVFPDNWIDWIWVGSDKSTVLLVFIAVFLQQQTWQSMINIGESKRLTVRVHALNVSISGVHMLLVAIFWKTMGLTVELVFGLVILEYLLVFPFAWRVLYLRDLESGEWDGRGVLQEYRSYCVPLISLSCLSFVITISDRWFLQNFGGSREQAFYSIGNQFSVICLLLTTSILKIFWKEISVMFENNTLERTHTFYRKTCQISFVSTVLISGFLIPWSEEITRIFLGPTYADGAIALAIMFLFPIHQSLGQVCATMLMASSNTKTRLFIACITMGVSVPVSYFVQASPDALVPGFGLGAVGMAWKIVLLNVIWANLAVWLIARRYGWKFDWAYQVVSLVAFLSLSWFSFEFISGFDFIVSLGLIIKASVTLLLYSVLSGLIILAWPWILGMTREELLSNISYTLRLSWTK